jgi:ribosomal protein L32
VTKEERHSALQEYRRAHRACPECGGVWIRRKMVGFNMFDPTTYRDENRAICDDCQWVGTVHDLVPVKEV